MEAIAGSQQEVGQVGRHLKCSLAKTGIDPYGLKIFLQGIEFLPPSVWVKLASAPPKVKAKWTELQSS